MKSIFTFLGILLMQHLQAQQLHLCFHSTDSIYQDDPFYVSFNVIDKDWANGFVQYKGQKGGLLLTFSQEKILKKDANDQPLEIEYSFNEWTNGKTSGKYFLVLAGSQVVSFHYFDKRRKSYIHFEPDNHSSDKCACHW